ncbi:hypothetical protein M3223_00450 [Paenibacillus pasadenensis]|uniref:hypothetical protein n=1 Tax=Paenibacillus pasadenensis TaxID=217090 RepID=UPI00203C3AD0|nr:hypothetical protein [Paenibacillus pasadenensis]MCM3745812.1 hypothetical protein [Paenibacillus pasadenensis]
MVSKASSITDWYYLIMFGVIMIIILLASWIGFRKLVKADMDEPEHRSISVSKTGEDLPAEPKAADDNKKVSPTHKDRS